MAGQRCCGHAKDFFLYPKPKKERIRFALSALVQISMGQNGPGQAGDTSWEATGERGQLGQEWQ